MLTPTDVALIFDLDNTLVHSTIDFPDIRRQLIGLLRSAGATSESDAALMVLAIPQLAELGAQISRALAERMWEVIAAAEDAGMQNAGPVEHAPDVLRELVARRFRLGLLTNNSRAGTVRLIQSLGLDVHFDAIATRDDVGNLKPMPDGVTHLLASLPGIRRAYVIGDSWIDGLAADAAGARFIGFGSRDVEVRARGVQPWAWITDLRQLLTLNLLE